MTDLDLDLTRPTRIHVVGVGGAGMSAIAAVLVAMGHQVTGSDLKAGPGLDRLRVSGVEVAVGHDRSHLGDAELVAISTAIPPTNPEVLAAEEAGIPVLRRAAVLAAIASTRRTIAVAGTHGKTTTSSMLALALRSAGLAPSFIIGGDVNEIGSGAAWSDAGDLFVVEADESDGTFTELPRDGSIVTNLEPDHLEHYGGFEGLEAAFDRFVAETPGPVVICVDDEGGRRLAARHPNAIGYGERPDAEYRMTELVSDRSGARFGLSHHGQAIGPIDLAVPGRHNARNAAAAAVTALRYGAEFDAVADALARYAGVARRYEHRGECNGITFVDDYAHLPTEVAAALATARDGAWPRVVCVFQPHRYSRTQEVGHDFGPVFTDAHHVLITEIYAAGEAPRPGVSGRMVAEAVRAASPGLPVDFVAHRTELVERLTDLLQPGDLCLTLGAGDLSSLPDELIERLGAP
ncbi:MAG: UDP-N-acetylmuramate--L-alanine ligase [Acidimicrobiia bacterium]|nr:UDP-N-acetylmuramate--L-alanine ligase [Acidimicrobiia bacterium]